MRAMKTTRELFFLLLLLSIIHKDIVKIEVQSSTQFEYIMNIPLKLMTIITIYSPNLYIILECAGSLTDIVFLSTNKVFPSNSGHL